MKKIYLSIFIVVFSANLFAQVPGYMGKRLSLEFDCMLFSAFKNPTMGEYDTGDEAINRVFSLNTRNRISLDYTLFRKALIGFGVEFFKTRYTFDPGLRYIVVYTDGSVSSEEYFESNMPIGNISATCFNLHYAIFQGEGLAPLGRYTQFEFGVIRFNSTYDEEMLLDEYGVDFYHPFEIELEDNSPYHTIYFGITFGKKRIYFDRLILNSGMQFCYVPNKYGLKEIFAGYNSLNEANFLEIKGKHRVAEHMGFNLSLGIGFLIF
ncbi:hypothetical protein ACFLQ5_03100 [Bacteroidota bacterium]